MKKITTEAILTVIIAPIIIWFAGFVISSYSSMADVSNIKDDIKEIKTDVKQIHYILINK